MSISMGMMHVYTSIVQSGCYDGVGQWRRRSVISEHHAHQIMPPDRHRSAQSSSSPRLTGAIDSSTQQTAMMNYANSTGPSDSTPMEFNDYSLSLGSTLTYASNGATVTKLNGRSSSTQCSASVTPFPSEVIDTYAVPPESRSTSATVQPGTLQQRTFPIVYKQLASGKF